MEIEEDKILAAFDSAKTPEAKKIKPSLEDYKSIRTYEDACEALEEETILNKTTRMMYDNLGNIIGEFPKHIIALMKLETISRALWGKNFEPKPDAEGTAIYYYPWFVLYTEVEIENMDDDDKGALLFAYAAYGATAGFGYLSANHRSSSAGAGLGFRLCQETEEKAKYFGKQFANIWAEYLAFNFTTGERIK